MKRDEMYYAREDIAFNSWVDARKQRLAATRFDPEAVRDLVRSAFLSGTRFGSEEAEVQALVGTGIKDDVLAYFTMPEQFPMLREKVLTDPAFAAALEIIARLRAGSNP